MRYSALKSMLLLPPTGTFDVSSLGETERISKPRMLYSPPRKILLKIGSTCVCPYGVMYSPDTRKPNDVRFVCGKYQMPSARGLTKFVLPPMPAKSKDIVYRLP